MTAGLSMALSEYGEAVREALAAAKERDRRRLRAALETTARLAGGVGRGLAGQPMPAAQQRSGEAIVDDLTRLARSLREWQEEIGGELQAAGRQSRRQRRVRHAYQTRPRGSGTQVSFKR